MNKNAQALAIEPLNETDHQASINAKKMHLKRQTEAAIRIQLAEFAKEIEQLKKLHKQH